MSLLELTPAGLYCPAADVYIDPCRRVPRAVITHGHSDHARPGSRHYLCHEHSVPILRARLGNIDSTGLKYGETVSINGVQVSLHPAGHLLGSAQVRIEHRGEVWVVSGDYKIEADPTCVPFEPVRCHGFVSEATFALPVYHWPAADKVAAEIDRWWQQNAAVGRTSVMFAYSLGKAQRLLAMLPQLHGPLFLHDAVLKMVNIYRQLGVELPAVQPATTENILAAKGTGLVITPPAADGGQWLAQFGAVSKATASGWMQLRGTRRRGNLDRAFVLSDHADWPGLQSAIAATGAEQVWITHGFCDVFARYLLERGVNARVL